MLTETQVAMRATPQSYLAPSITDCWLRRYQVALLFVSSGNYVLTSPLLHLQVLPGRTHPEMTASGSGGFLLHAIKMWVFPAFSHNSLNCRAKLRSYGNVHVSSTLVFERRSRRQRLAEAKRRKEEEAVPDLAGPEGQAPQDWQESTDDSDSCDTPAIILPGNDADQDEQAEVEEDREGSQDVMAVDEVG